MDVTTGWVIKRKDNEVPTGKPVFLCLNRQHHKEVVNPINEDNSPLIFTSEEGAEKHVNEKWSGNKGTKFEIVPLVLALQGKEPKPEPKPVKLLPTGADDEQPLRTVGELRSFISNLDDSMLLCGTSMSGYNSVFPIRAKARTTPPPGVRGWASNPYVSFTGYASPGSPNRYSNDWKELVQDEPTA